MTPQVLPAPPTSGGEWAAWAVGALGVLLLMALGALAYVYREHRKTERERIDDMRKTVDAVAPSAAALHTVAQGHAVLVERVDGLEDRIDKHDERIDGLDCTPPTGPRRSQR